MGILDGSFSLIGLFSTFNKSQIDFWLETEAFIPNFKDHGLL